MAVTKKDVNGSFYFTYPSSDVFLKERNYFIFEGVQDDTYIKTVKIGDKTLNFGRYALDVGAKFYLDVSAYYAKYFGKFNVVITYENIREEVVTNTIAINATTYECYDPYKEVVPQICGETNLSIITPPFRMLFVDNYKVNSLFVLELLDKKFHWIVNSIKYTSDFIMVESISNNPFAHYKNPNQSINNSIERHAVLADPMRNCVYVTWRTRWGMDVSHVFYLDTYATDKDNAQEVESEYYYKEHSKHVIKGSFYLDNIREPYDLWYYQTLANSELVTLTFDRWDTLPATYMPNGTNAFNGVKITGCNIKDAVVDGVAQSTITFDFEMR